MSRLKWDEVGKRFYETGVDRGVLYPIQQDDTYSKGAAWSGLIGVDHKPSGAEATGKYADNMKYLNLISAEDLAGTIKAYYYPPEWGECDGSATVAPGVTVGQQSRKMFGLCYRTKLGNDTVGQNYGYKLHLVWGARATPSERNYGTTNESPDAIEFSWEFTTTPVDIPGFEPSAGMEIDSTGVTKAKLAALEDILYGAAEKEARLPMPAEIIELLGEDVVAAG